MPSHVNRRPPKPRPDFPLTAHANGQWCKWIKPKGAPRSEGRVVFFGVWADPVSAEALYLAERADWEAGKDPRLAGTYTPSGIPTLVEIADRWLVKQEQRTREGVCSARSYMDKRRAIAEMLKHFPKDTDATKLKPDDFEALRRHLGQGVGPSSLSQRVIHIRAMFRWAGPENQRLLPSLPHWADKFANVTEAERLEARDDNEKLNGERKFSVETAHAILREINRRADTAWAEYRERGVGQVSVVAQRWLLAVNLIAANTGAYASDIAALAPEDVDLDGQRWIDKKRVKTRRHRIKWQAPLWPETIAAIRSYQEVRPASDPDALEVWRQRRASESDAPAFKQAAMRTEPIFLTTDGCPIVHEQTHYRWDGVVRANTPMDSVGQAMRALLGAEGMGVKYHGLNFGAWRHTFKSLAEETGREKFVKRIMGHTVGKIDERYFKPTADQLRLVTDLVRDRLLPPEMRIVSGGDGDGR